MILVSFVSSDAILLNQQIIEDAAALPLAPPDATTVITQPVDADGNAIGPAAFTEI